MVKKNAINFRIKILKLYFGLKSLVVGGISVEFVLSCSMLSSCFRSKGLRCSIFCETASLLLRLWFLYSNEGVQLVEVSVDGDATSSYFSPVVHRSTKYVSVLSSKKVLNPGSCDCLKWNY